ncbi:MAG: dihydroneopterin aldolase [Acutalibacteraceae bacterium]|jgi:dihydroneopterin aldolase
MGKITVKGLKIYAYHGVNPEEKQNGQFFIMDIEAYSDLSSACISDRLEDTVSYAKIAKKAAVLFTAQKDNLLERASMRVAEGLLEEFPSLERIKINLKKPDAPVDLDFEYMAVEIDIKRSSE